MDGYKVALVPLANFKFWRAYFFLLFHLFRSFWGLELGVLTALIGVHM